MVGLVDAVCRNVHRPHQPRSHHRSIRDGSSPVPTLGSLVWFSIFGGAAVDQQRKTGSLVGDGGVVSTDAALFQLLELYPIASISTVLVMVLVGVLFVPGADAASMVIIGGGGENR